MNTIHSFTSSSISLFLFLAFCLNFPEVFLDIYLRLVPVPAIIQNNCKEADASWYKRVFSSLLQTYTNDVFENRMLLKFTSRGNWLRFRRFCFNNKNDEKISTLQNMDQKSDASCVCWAALKTRMREHFIGMKRLKCIRHKVSHFNRKPCERMF